MGLTRNSLYIAPAIKSEKTEMLTSILGNSRHKLCNMVNFRNFR